MKRFTVITMMLCFGALLFSQGGQDALPSQTSAATRYVAVQSAAVKDSTGFFAKDVGVLALGTEVTALGENGNWTQIRAGNLSGWVASSSLSARRVVSANSNVTASEVAMAGKGFSPDMEIEYKKEGLDYSAVDSMETINVAPNELLGFITEGHLKEGK